MTRSKAKIIDSCGNDFDESPGDTAASEAFDNILVELISAVSLQRFRLADCDADVCRTMTRTASVVVGCSMHLLMSQSLPPSSGGLFELLLGASAHENANVSAMAIETLTKLVAKADVGSKLLPVLQSKACWEDGSDPDFDGMDEEEFERFRGGILSDALNKCYLFHRSLYVSSTVVAFESLLSSLGRAGSAPPTSLDRSRIDATLYCLSTASLEISKRALLVNATPAQKQRAARIGGGAAAAGGLAPGEALELIDSEARVHHEGLCRVMTSLMKFRGWMLSDALLCSSVGRFLTRYAQWCSKSPEILDAAADVALEAFKRSPRLSSDKVTVRPFNDASSAIRNLLYRAPRHFAGSPTKMEALSDGWTLSYAAVGSAGSGDGAGIEFEDRQALASGICRVLASLSSKEDFARSVLGMVRPSVEIVSAVFAPVETHSRAGGEAATMTQPQPQPPPPGEAARASDEIRLISVVMRSFKVESCLVSQGSDGNLLVTIIKSVWLSVLLAAKCCSNIREVADALGDLMRELVSIRPPIGASLAWEICGAIVETRSPYGYSSALAAAEEAADVHGPSIDDGSCSNEVRSAFLGMLESGNSGVVSSRIEDVDPMVVSCFLSCFNATVRRCPITSVRHLGGSYFRGCVGMSVRVVAGEARETHCVRDAAMAIRNVLRLRESAGAKGREEGERPVRCVQAWSLIGCDVESVLVNIRDEALGVCALAVLGGEQLEDNVEPIGSLIYDLLVRCDWVGIAEISSVINSVRSRLRRVSQDDNGTNNGGELYNGAIKELEGACVDAASRKQLSSVAEGVFVDKVRDVWRRAIKRGNL